MPESIPGIPDLPPEQEPRFQEIHKRLLEQYRPGGDAIIEFQVLTIAHATYTIERIEALTASVIEREGPFSRHLTKLDRMIKQSRRHIAIAVKLIDKTRRLRLRQRPASYRFKIEAPYTVIH